MLDAMAAAAAAEGMTREDAVTLARQTMLGTARILAERGTSPAELMAAVASPGGTTAAGLKVLERSVLKGIIARTIGAAAARSRELSK
jgi:pyrroline-5-carboxylate reductase